MSSKGEAFETHGARDPVDRGLAAAFGEESRARPPHPSVLRVLEERTKSKLGVHLESQGLEDAPVKVTDEVKALRDPSGRYQVLGEIGRGGMGVVYKGRDQDLGRDVAMKVLKDEYASRPDVLARFVEEAQIGGQLQHPGIVPVYELGLQSGERPYFAMKLVKGETLAAQLAKRSDAMQERRRLLGIFEQVCQTMAYAHARHVVHRDLKPANVMIGAFGEVQVVDWGFAKVLQKGALDATAASKRVEQLSVIDTARSRADSGSHSVAGSMMGTPAYMPPEQALGDIARVDERSDVFALGAILCELLTGEAPYREQDGDLVRQAAQAQLDGAHERLAKCGADEALVALCNECLSPSQRARPASAGEVADRVSSYLTSVEERARQSEVRAAEARLKHRVTLLSAAAGLAVLMAGTGAWIWIDGQARARRSEATQRVASGMSAASGARGRAESATLDLSLWSTAVASSEQLVSLARSEDVDAKTRADAEALLASVQEENRAATAESERRQRDATMRAELELARIPIDDDVRNIGEQELRRLDAAYARAFGTYLGGASLFDQANENALASMRRGNIQVELAGSLDHWGLVRDALRTQSNAPDPAGTARIRDIAKELDSGDAWRTKLRALLPNAATQRAGLRELAEQADFTTMTAVGCRVLSQALWSAGEKEMSVTILRRGQELHPRDFDLCFQLALRLELLDEPRVAEALDAYRIAHAIRPEQTEVLHREVLALGSLKRHVDEERIASIALARNPLDAHWVQHHASALTGQGRTDEAIAEFRKAIELDAKRPMPHSALAEAFVQQNKLDEASAELRRAIELDPSSAGYQNNLGSVLLRQDKRDEAKACYRTAMELDSKDADSRANMAILLQQEGKLDEAIVLDRAAIELNPKQSIALNNLGEALRQQDKLDEAIPYLRRAVELEPTDAGYLSNLGRVLVSRGELEEAAKVAERAMKLASNDASAYLTLGNTFQALRRLDDAVTAIRRALEIDPQLVGALNNLGVVLTDQGKRDEAMANYRRALEIEPRSAPAVLNLGGLLAERGELEPALALFRDAERIFADDPSPFGRAWLERSREVIALAEKGLARLPALSEVLDGRRAVSSEEWNAAVQFGYDQKRYREVVALTESTLRDAPELIGGFYGAYFPACVAALLAAEGEVAGIATDERARLREEARVWLTREAERCITQLDTGGSDAEDCRDFLKHVQEDPDLASVRGGAIDALPESERMAWRALWKRIVEGAAK